MSRSIQKSARERAMAAKRELDAARAELDRKIEEAATAFYVADAELQEAEAKRTNAVRTLVRELGQEVDYVSALLGLHVRDINRLRRISNNTLDQDEAGRTDLDQDETDLDQDETGRTDLDQDETAAFAAISGTTYATIS